MSTLTYTLSSDIHIKKASKQLIETKTLLRLGTNMSKFICKKIEINSAIVKNHEQIMHLTETSIGFILVSTSACTE